MVASYLENQVPRSIGVEVFVQKEESAEYIMLGV